MQGVVCRPVVLRAGSGQRDRVLDVVPIKVVRPNAVVGIVSAHVSYAWLRHSGGAAAQQAAVADAAVRPRDRALFDIWNRPERFADLSGRRS